MSGSLDDPYSHRMGQPSNFSPSSDLQTLESNFRRLGVSDSNARQQPLLDRSNQFPLNGIDRGINARDYLNPIFQPQSEPEQTNLAQRLWFGDDNRVNGYDAYESSNYGSYRRSTSGLWVPPEFIHLNIPFSPSNHYDRSPWSYSHGYVPGTRTNHDLFTMNRSRATDTTLSRAKDLVESPKLQNVIAEGSRETVDKIFFELIPHVCELMIDSLGHQVFQKLLEKCKEEQISLVLDIVIQQPIQFVRLCDDSYGTRAVQDLMRFLCSEEKISRFMVTLCHVALLMTKSTNRNNVIIFCFGHFSLSQTNCLLQVIVQNCYQVATDQYGCCMLQQIIGKFSREIKNPLIMEIINNALSLSLNCYGNYAVQYVLELGNYQVGPFLSRYLDGNYVQLSFDKYGSHVVQKCLTSRQFNTRRIIKELLSDIDSLLVHPLGNYVIQTAWDVSQDDMRSELLYHINKNYPLMSCNSYGRKILKNMLWN